MDFIIAEFYPKTVGFLFKSKYKKKQNRHFNAYASVTLDFISILLNNIEVKYVFISTKTGFFRNTTPKGMQNFTP